MLRKPGIAFVMTGASGVVGGIQTLNLNILAALSEVCIEADRRLEVLSYLETAEHRPPTLADRHSFQAASGNKAKFIIKLLRIGLNNSPIVFDHVTLALPILPLVKMRRTQSIIFAHGSESWKNVRSTSVKSFRSASLVIANSTFTKRKILERNFLGNLVSCPLGLSPLLPLNPIDEVQTEPLHFEAASGQRKQLTNRFFLLVSRLNPLERRKGHWELVSVLPAIKAKFPDVQLVFAGPGEDRDNLKDHANKSGVGDSVFVLGKVPLDVLQMLYASCFAFTMPSKQEGFGLVFLEAMNFRKPCLGCFDDGAEDVIVNGETGLLISDPKCQHELKTALLRLLDDPDYARKLGQNGYQRLREKFTSEKYRERLKLHLIPYLT